MSHSVNHRVRQDIAWGLMVVGIFIGLALQGQWSETLNAWLHRYEWLDLDELMLSLGVVLVVLSWFSWRRWHDLSHQLRANAQLQSQRDQLSAQNRMLSQQVLSAQEDERRELARELHDEIAQVCTAIRYDAAFLMREVNTDTAQLTVGRIEHSAMQMHELTRTMLKRLRPAHLDSLGFVDALQNLCQQWQTQTGVDCLCEIDWPASVDADYLKTSLYRVVQEALTNVARHAQASQVRVRLTQQPNHVTLEVIDNGVGIPNTDRHEEPTQGLGMLGIRERMASLGGEALWSQLARGTRLHCVVPVAVGEAP